ncbi:twin-arginine translocation signal domain-containing protein [Halorussus ruber]|uniref:twin-arginine translocation signal domain-containing protein n=1 Tax=Halorussus ruber TaxID=1126238 RepID=UPI001093229F|nr:twin-arginine translocation signal domain-containing protein [Halorussus ruber]
MTDNSTRTNRIPDVDERDRRDFLKALGLAGSVGAASELSLSDLRGAVGEESAEELATVGERIRADLAGGLDGGLLAGAVTGIEESVAALPELRAAGFPDAPDTAGYAALTEPAWDAYDHLAEVGFFASAEQHLPEFTPDHVRATVAELIRAEPLAGALADAGLGERERTAVVVDATTENQRLAQWVSTARLPANPDEYDPADVAPLHQRALGGGLLWIDELDQHLWQREVVLTEDHLDAGVWDAKRILAGTHLFVTAARDLAGPEDLENSQLAAALAGGSALAVRGQEAIADDVFRISDAERAPMGGNS